MRKELTAWGPALAWVVVLFLLSRITRVPSSLDVLAVLPDKAVHATLYTALGVALAWGRRTSRWKPHPFLLLALGSLYGALDEWHQSFVPRRSPEPADWLADTMGVILGYLAAAVWLRSRSRRGRTREDDAGPGPA